jgi:hypothetical protein
MCRRFGDLRESPARVIKLKCIKLHRLCCGVTLPVDGRKHFLQTRNLDRGVTDFISRKSARSQGHWLASSRSWACNLATSVANLLIEDSMVAVSATV